MGDAEATDAEYKSLSPSDKGKGGFRACTFVFVLTAFESMGFVANMASMVLYFFLVMHFNIPSSANTLTNFMGSTFLLSIVGGFLSDTYLSRYTTILIFGVLETLALVLVTIQAYSNDLQPKYCGKPSCVEGGIEVMFYASLSLLALGSGGVRGALPTLGGDQFDPKNPDEAKHLASFFNWATLSTVMGASVGVTGVVWVSMNKGWYKGFIISTVVTFVGFLVLAAGKPFFRIKQPGESPLIRIVQVVVLAIKNRKLELPKNSDELYELGNGDQDSSFTEEKISHTEQFRFFDKAAILPKESKPAQWEVCTVTQVEEVKVLTRMLPILASTIIMNTCLAQLQTFSIQQGNAMNLHLGKLKVPPPSIPAIPLLFMIILIPIYEFSFVPFARKITGHPSGITQLQRVGVGLVLSAISMAVAGIVEVKRRNQAYKDSHHPISLFWLSFQYGIFGIADMFTLVGLLEFFYKEAPSGMKSLSTSFTWLSLSFGYFLSTVFVSIINAITERVTPSKQGWLHGDDLNSNNLHLFYFFLAILSSLNFANYLYWASWYKYKSEDDSKDPKPKTNEASDVLLLARDDSIQDSVVSKTASNVNDNEEESTQENAAKKMEAGEDPSAKDTSENQTQNN